MTLPEIAIDRTVSEAVALHAPVAVGVSGGRTPRRRPSPPSAISTPSVIRARAS